MLSVENGVKTFNCVIYEQEICNYGDMPQNSTQKNVQLKNHEISYLNAKLESQIVL